MSFTSLGVEGEGQLQDFPVGGSVQPLANPVLVRVLKPAERKWPNTWTLLAEFKPKQNSRCERGSDSHQNFDDAVLEERKERNV